MVKKTSIKVSKKSSKKSSVNYIKKRFTKVKFLNSNIHLIDNKDYITRKEFLEFIWPSKLALVPIYRKNAFNYLESIADKISKKLAKKTGEDIQESMTGYSDLFEYIEDCVSKYRITKKNNYIGSRMNKKLTNCFIWQLTNWLFQESFENEKFTYTVSDIKKALSKTRINKILK